MRVDFLAWQNPAWQHAAALIETHFRKIYDARISLPPVELAVIVSDDGRILGAAGVRDHAQGFFSQVYLDKPVDRVLSGLTGRPVAADEIFEVVSMACPQSRATLPLIEAITEEGRRRGKGWGLFTATGPLMRLLTRTGVPLVALSPARPERLAHADQWGSYYATSPWVCALPDRQQSLRFVPRRPGLNAVARLK